LRTFGLLGRSPALLALVVGALSAFAFEPFALWPLMPLAFACLCALISRDRSLWRALLTGWCFGLGQFVVGLNWIATAFTYQAAMPAWLGWVAVVLLSFYLAVYPALAAGLAWRFGKNRPVALVLALAGAWPIIEWLRGTVFTGFPWNPVGVTLVDTPWLFLSTFIGTYGLSLLVVPAGGALWLAFNRRWKPALTIAVALGLILLLPAPMVSTECCLRTFDADNPSSLITVNPEDHFQTPATGAAYAPPVAPPPPGTTAKAPPVPAPPAIPPPPPSGSDAPLIDPGFSLGRSTVNAIRIVQPNIGQEDKWRPGLADEAFARLAQLSAGGPDEPRILFWPEVAVPEPFQILGPDRQPLPVPLAAIPRAMQSIRPGDILLTGAFALIADSNGQIAGNTNSVVALTADGRILGRYDKAHLVPYGEYLPMRPLLSAIGLSQLAPGQGDTIYGPGPRTLDLGRFGRVGVQVCYEIVFSGEVVDESHRPDFIFNPSNDAWFGRWGPPQHLAQARLRATEEGLPIVRSTPTGISALIAADGRLIASLPWRTAGVIDGHLPQAAPPTPFSRLGNVVPLAIGFLLIALAIALGGRRRYRHT
jgi:apolipoprotein N-acyltransferase